MQLLDSLEAGLRDLEARHLRRRRRTTDTPCAPAVRVDGRDMLAFCSNDYLGLAAHPAVIAALADGAVRYGAGSGASHLISGHSRAHAQLEERLAAMLAPHIEQARALYFCTGYMANLAALGALADKDAEIYSEALNHASLIDGARLSRARVHVYPHGDTGTLGKLLAGSRARTRLIVTDGVFSMDGDIAPLRDLLALAERHGAWLVVDDAHGFGVLGRHGHGVLEHLGLNSPHLVMIGTLGKAAGVGGAFVAAHATVIDWLVNRARPYIFSTAAAPAQAHALLASLDLIEGAEGAQRRAHLRALTGRLQAGLRLRRWRHVPTPTAIQPIVLGENVAALRAAAALERAALWVPAIRPPTVPPGTARLRVTLSAAHQPADVDRLVHTLNRLEEEPGHA
ncbi:8-amino-7-oxononanoate synthase [Bordetella petrii]|uniref:8-amino-7-oxononanoate synthase n=1 Tax=Bordetella petrii TaxID=94624 RepID=UPI003730D281